MVIKTHKRKKSSRMHGHGMGTHGTGSRKNQRKSGHHGGVGMSGSGKRGDHKKTKITKLYGHNYFGKKGMTSRGTKRDKRLRINVGDIQSKYSAGEVNLKNYKILGSGEVKDKFVIKAKEASASAVKKIENAGGKIIFGKKKEIEKKEEDIKEKKSIK